MISKKSFIKLVQDDIKKRIWLWLLSGLIFCLLLPGTALDAVQGTASIGEDVNSFFLEVMAQGRNYYYLVGTGIMALTCALSGFAYIHSRNKLDFYHSLPVSRSTWLWIQYVSGFLAFFVPAVVGMLEELVIGVIYRAVEGKTVQTAVLTLGIYCVIFFLIYQLCVFAMMITGKMVVSVMMIPCVFGFTWLMFWIYRMFQATFYQTYYQLHSTSIFEKYPSPATLIKEMADQWGNFAGESIKSNSVGMLLSIMVFACIILLVANLWLYRIRKSEVAGNAMVFRKVALGIKFLIVVTASLGVGIYLKTFSYTQSDLWFFGGIALGILVFCAVLDFVYFMDIRGVLSKPLQLAAMTLVTFGVALTFRLDFLGYDSYLPDIHDISSMSVYNRELCVVYQQSFVLTDEENSRSIGDASQNMLDSYQMTEFEPIYAMAENGRDNTGKEWSEDGRYVNVDVRYNLLDGRSVYRSYWVDRQVFTDSAEKLYEKQGFIRAMYPVFQRDVGQMQAVSASGVNMNSGGYIYFESLDEKEAFADAYKEDLLTLAFDEISGEDVVGTISISYQTSGSSVSSVEDAGYPVMGKFTRTLEFLETMGIHFDRHLDPDEVKALEVWKVDFEDSVNLLSVEAGKPDLITEQEKKELLESFTYQYCLGTSLENDVYYFTAYGGNGEYLQTFQIPYEVLPEKIQELLEENLKKDG